MRPSDWFLVDLPVDPTPGDAFGIRQLAAKYAEIALIAGDAAVAVRHARSSGAASAWVGDAGDIFREKSERMPGELATANDSYLTVAEALARWASELDDSQAQADRGLQCAREAHSDLTSARVALAAAQREWTTVAAQQLTFQQLQKTYLNVPPPPSITLPTPAQLGVLDRNAHSAQASIANANTRIADASARLDAARAMVMEAKTRRDDAERRTVRQIDEAGDRAVQPSSIWEAIQDSAAWQVIVQVATVVVTIASIVAIVVGGPLVWAIILAATALLIVNALLSIAQGKDAWVELASLAVGLIPGGAVVATGVRMISVSARVAGTLTRLIGMRRVVDSMTELVTRGSQVKTIVIRLDAEATRFTQTTVSFHKIDRLTGERYTLDDLIASMRTAGWKGDPVDTVRMPDGGISSVDNTRVLAAREAGIPLKAHVHEMTDPLNPAELERFSATKGRIVETWGDAALNRIQTQKPNSWAQISPFGSLNRPRVTGRP